MFKRLLIVLLLVGFCAAAEPFGTHLFADDYIFSVGDEVVVSANLVYFNGSGDECNLSDGNITANITNNSQSLTNCTNGDGFVSFDFGKLDAGNYSVEFSYSGNGNYSSCNESINVNVLPSTPPDNNNSSIVDVDIGGGSVVDGVGVGLPVSGFDLNVLLFLFCVLIGCFIKM